MLACLLDSSLIMILNRAQAENVDIFYSIFTVLYKNYNYVYESKSLLMFESWFWNELHVNDFHIFMQFLLYLCD